MSYVVDEERNLLQNINADNDALAESYKSFFAEAIPNIGMAHALIDDDNSHLAINSEKLNAIAEALMNLQNHFVNAKDTVVERLSRIGELSVPYDDSETYQKGNIVSYDSVQWICVDDNVTGTFDPTKWVMINSNSFGFDIETEAEFEQYVGTTLIKVNDEVAATINFKLQKAEDDSDVLDNVAYYTIDETAYLPILTFKFKEDGNVSELYPQVVAENVSVTEPTLVGNNLGQQLIYNFSSARLV